MHRDFNINVKSNHKIPVVFHNLKNYDSQDYKIGTYKINKISLPCFDDKIYVQNNGSISSWLLELIIKKQLS